MQVLDHTIRSGNLFNSIAQTLNSFVKLPNRENITVTHPGTANLSENLFLKDVFCALRLHIIFFQ